jgi:hypothetical protein
MNWGFVIRPARSQKKGQVGGCAGSKAQKNFNFDKKKILAETI